MTSHSENLNSFYICGIKMYFYMQNYEIIFISIFLELFTVLKGTVLNLIQKTKKKPIMHNDERSAILSPSVSFNSELRY